MPPNAQCHMIQPSESLISKTWVLFDNASTVDVFVNPDLVTNIRAGPHRLRILCAAGAVYTNQIADFPGYGWVLYLPGGFANIQGVSLCQVTQKFRVIYDSAGENSGFIVHRPEQPWYFQQSQQGLYYIDMTTPRETCFVTTVSDLEQHYSNRDIMKAKEQENCYG